MNAREAAEWHRAQAQRLAGRAARATIHRERPKMESACHEVAADVLTELADPEVGDTLHALGGAVLVRCWDADGGFVEVRLTSEQRAAFVALAKIGDSK